MPFEEVESADVLRVLRESIEQLPEKQREVIKTRYLGNKSLRKAATALNISRGGVAFIESKALISLRKMEEIKELADDFYRHTGHRSFIRHEASAVELAAELREKLNVELREKLKQLQPLSF